LPDEVQDEKVARHITKRTKDESVGMPPIDSETLRKYIFYARSNIAPLLSDEADEKIIEWYVKTRSLFKNSSLDLVVDARRLQAVRRLAMARARGRLDRVANVSDVDRAIELQKKFLREFGIDPDTGVPSQAILTRGYSDSISQMKELVIKVIRDKSRELNIELVPFDFIVEGIQELLPTLDNDEIVDKVERCINILKESDPTEILEPSSDRCYKLL
jgi:replicative DNA helicase Mcm